jgi:hypothetical protein
MKALKILGAIVAVLGLAVAIFWFGWLSPPDAQDVCDNVARITKDATGVDVPAKAKEECVQSASKAPDFGRAIWVKQLRCMRDAKNHDELQGCDKVRL